MIPFVHSLEGLTNKITGKTGVRFEAWPLFILGLSALLVAFVFIPATVVKAMSLSLFLAPLWLPVLLLYGAHAIWYILKRSQFIANQEYIVLELKPPRSLVKTPLAMETFLSAIHLTGGESTWWARFKGGIRPYYSLELASFEGQIHFYLWTRASLRRMIEGQLYAQYPGIQIVEAPDYTRTMSADPHEWVIWGCDFKHTADAPLPIKTYIEFGLDKVQEEPEQVDPIAQLIEYMGSIGKGEQLWLQFVIRAHRGERYGTTPGGVVSTRLNNAEKPKPYTWRDEGIELIEKIRKSARNPYIDPVTGEERPGFPNPTKGESEKMAAIDRNTSKLAFDVGARSIYFARPEHFDGSTIGHMIGLFKPFTSEGWNGINSTNWMKKFDDYPWEIGVEKRKNHFRHELVEAYRRRQFFYHPFFEGGLMPEETMIMSTEELATVYHIPSSSVASPGVSRIQSAMGEAPPNLPT